MPKFHFENVEIAKRWILSNIGRKWSNHKSTLWVEFYDPSLTREQLISNCPAGIHRDQWSTFVINRLSEKSKETCRRNAESRKCQKIPHTNGSKSFARRKAEMENELGRKVNRSELWLDTHKRKDGTYVNDEAKSKSDEIIREMSRSSYSSQSQFALPDDPLGRVFGKEHAGRVRGAGFGPCPTIAFGCRFGSSYNDGQMREYVASMEKELAATKSILRAQSLQLDAKNVQMEDIKKNLGGALTTIFENALGKIPEQFASWLNQTSNFGPSDERSTHPPSSENERRDSSSSRDVT
ncbi:Unknown protein [Striga hermonthica]|uniref:Transposase, Ptta/En/Spm, plant n=1 Tax=Striga hermonthica TaxID=68872 RepID=A0A9N7N4F8_STRHE|nr:Unknown protein [Striga hermonthica]